MGIIKTKTLSALQSAQINQMWNDEYPVMLKDRFPILLDGVENYQHYLLEDSHQNVIAWAVDFEKENETRFSIIVAEAHQGKGLGSLLIRQLKEEHHTFYGWVIDHNNDIKTDGTHYQTPLPFYLNHGFTLTDQRLKTEIIDAIKIKWSSM